jgi:FlaG/FlaF family flagellin (archaellin)
MHRAQEIDPEYENIEAEINQINLQLTKQNNSNSPMDFHKNKKDGIVRSHDGELDLHKVSEKSSDNTSDNTANDKKDHNNPLAIDSEKK